MHFASTCSLLFNYCRSVTFHNVLTAPLEVLTQPRSHGFTSNFNSSAIANIAGFHLKSRKKIVSAMQALDHH